MTLAPIAVPGASLGLFGLVAALMVGCAVAFVLLCIHELENDR